MVGGFFVISFGYWGWGADVNEAKARHRKAGGKLTRGYAVYSVPDGVEFLGVGQGGYYEWRDPEETDDTMGMRKPQLIETVKGGGK